MDFKGKTVLVLLAAVIITGCGSPSPKPMATEGVFESVPKENVFDAAVKILHFTGYTIQAISRESGVISTDWFVFKLKEGGGKGMYKMNILIYDDENRQARVSIKVKARWEHDDKSITTEQTAQALINNLVASHINRLYQEIGKVVGQPQLMGNYTVKLE